MAKKDSEQLYKKVGGRYIKVGRFPDEPADGIWMVVKTAGGRSYRRVCRIAELPDMVKVTKLERYRDQLEKYLLNVNQRWISINEMITDIFSILAQGDDE